jgi:WRKY transcription factor 22
MDEERCFNNWDLDAVVRLACRRRLSPPPSQVNDPFDSFPPAQQGLPAAPNPANEADVDWRFPDLRAGVGQDGDELLRALLVAQPPMPLPALPTLPTPPPPPQQQQQQPPAVVPPAEVPAQARAAPASAPARAQPSGRMPGAVPRSKRR